MSKPNFKSLDEKSKSLKKLNNIKGLPFYKLRSSPERLFTQVNIRVINWLVHSTDIAITVGCMEYETLSRNIYTVFKTRGNDSGIKWLKEVRLCVMKYLEGNSMNTKSVSTDKHGLPLVLGSKIRKAIVNESYGDIRLCLTILNSSRSLSLGKVADIESIIKPFNKGDEYSSLITDFKLYTTSFWKANGYEWKLSCNWLPRKLRFTNFHFTTKTGPNGHALWTCLLDLLAIKDLSIFNDIKIIGGESFSRKVNLLVKFLEILQSLFAEWFESKVVTKHGLRNRKISSFPDKENKVRVIAIGDYFTQTVLKPLHIWLFKFLEKIPQDHTHNQGGFKTLLIQDNNSSKDKIVSADLSAATDRFPIEVISTVLKGRLPAGWVDSWERIMVKEPFDYNGDKINYSVGNPMGFYSSWASFATAHHFVIYYICRKNNINWRTARYALLGDDIVIKNDIISQEYKRIMSILGVEVSLLKTHSSDNFFEFAKRLFYKNKEVSPFPISSLQETHNKYYLIVNTLIELENKGWKFVNGIPAAVQSFYTIVLHRKKSWSKSLVTDSICVENIIKVMSNRLSSGVGLQTLAQTLGYSDLKAFDDDRADALLSNIAVELFSTSNPQSTEWQKKSQIPLGELATSWVMKLTGLYDHPNSDVVENIFDLIQAIPQLRGYGTIEETYMDLLKEARLIDTVKQGNWPKILRTMALPLDDRIFVQRTSHMISKGAMLVSKHLIPRFDIMRLYPNL